MGNAVRVPVGDEWVGVWVLDRPPVLPRLEAARTCEAQLGDAVREALRAFAEQGTALIGARDTGEALDAVIADGY